MPFYVIAVLFGLLIGSFLNVCIYRVPLGKSIVYPPSSCTACGASIKPYQNIPVISYIMLGGKCASCGDRISPIYPAVEALNALLYASALWRFGPSVKAVAVMAVLSVFIVVTFIDLRHRIIPNGITFPGVALSLLVGPLAMGTPWTDSVFGVLLGGGLFYLIAVISRGGMGGGDIKLIAMVGGLVGWKLTLFTIVVASALGAVVGVTMMALGRAGRKTPVPFGPFLVMAATLAIFCGENVVGWYVGQ